MPDEVGSLEELYTDPVLRVLNAVLLTVIVVYLVVGLATSPLSVWFTLLVAVTGIWAVVSGVYFDGVRGDEPLPRTHVAFLIAVLAGFYAFLAGIGLWVELFGILPDTDRSRLLAGAVTGLPLTGGLYGWALRRAA